jgi:molybdenum cofactor cytidylyltransferase
LAIGARAPGEIAIAILAELVRLRRSVRAPRIAGIVLAAGTSSRMGRNKLVENVRGKPLIKRAVDAAMASRLEPVLVVTGHQAGKIDAALAGTPVTLVHNEHFDQGLSSSLRAGLTAVPEDCDGAMILLGDMPDISPGLIDQLVDAFDPAGGHAICLATAGKRRGHPVLWDKKFFPELMKLSGDKGGREILQTHAGQVMEIEATNDAPLVDIDTAEALAAYRS